MKNLLIFISILLWMGTGTAFAQNRGALANIFASWYTVTTTTQTITFPYTSRDITIHNSDSNNAICVDLRGSGAISSNCFSNNPNMPSTIVLDVNTALSLTDFMTNAISFRTLSSNSGTTASAVSVIATY